MKPVRTAAAVALALAPVAADADIISPEPLPEEYFREVFIGRYAAPGRCETDDVADLLVVSEVGIQIGPVLCEGIGKRTWEDGRMLVPLSTCRIDARHRGPRTLSLKRETGGDLSVRPNVEDGPIPNPVMQRCGP